MRLQVKIDQGTEAWKNWRRTRVCASDTAVLLGISPWSTEHKLWCQKLGLLEEDVENFAMSEGKRLESEALALFNERYSDDLFAPTCFENNDYPWMGASMDGWNSHQQSGVEIKCSSKLLELGKEGIIPENYMCQMQTQMIVNDTKDMFYFPYFDGIGIPIEVKRDENYCSRIVKHSKEFWDKLQNLESPALTDKDYVLRDDEEWSKVAKDWLQHKTLREYYEKLEKEYKDRLIKLANNQSSQGANIRISRIVRKGNVDYEQLCKDYQVTNVETYRKAPIEQFRIGEIKGCAS